MTSQIDIRFGYVLSIWHRGYFVQFKIKNNKLFNKQTVCVINNNKRTRKIGRLMG